MAAEEVKYAILDRAFGVPKIDWHSRFSTAKSSFIKQRESRFNAAVQNTSDGDGVVAAAKFVGTYKAPGFGTWTFDETHLLAQPPEKLVDIVALPMLWCKEIQSLIWHVSGPSYKTCWAFSLHDGNAYEYDRLGCPLGMEMDVDDESGDVKGFGIRGLWGALPGFSSPSGQTVKKRAEVYFERIG